MVVCIRDWCTLGCMDNNGLCEACERTSCDRYCTGGGETLREEIKLVFTKQSNGQHVSVLLYSYPI